MNNNHNIYYEEVLSTALEKITASIPNANLLAVILAAALSAVNPIEAVKKNLRLNNDVLTVGDHSLHIEKSTRIVTIALGKAAPAMLQGAIEQLGSRYQGGVCVCKHQEQVTGYNPDTYFILGDHPVPGEGSIRAGNEIKRVVSHLSGDDVVLLLISGGGSALATLPVEGVTLSDLQEITGTLLRSGVNIAEMNSVRKHLDQIKGGGLVRLAAPARVVSLVLSDVVGNNLEVIASGPTYPDPTTYSDAAAIINQAAKHGNIPVSIKNHLLKGLTGLVPETLKSNNSDAQRCFNTIVASNVDACMAASEKANELGLKTRVVTTGLTGEARMAGKQVVRTAILENILHRPFMLVWGGETTVTVEGKGKGGRNQELALSAVKEMADVSNMLLVSMATDGEDGPTSAAGAIVTGDSLMRARILGLDPKKYLRDNDAYTFFEKLGDLLVTGPTGTNVNDLTFMFSY